MIMSCTPSDARDRESPPDLTTAARLLRDGARDRDSVLVTGARSKLGWGGPVIKPDLELSTARMNQLIGYRPGDMTVAVQAGMPLTELQSTLAEQGQWLAIDPPTETAGATIGGLLATGDAGPRRLRHGTLRDLAIGCTLVLADGTVAHAGGHVIKNVAGYDLTKLMHGSLGTLAMVGEVVLRLNPMPAASRTIVANLTPTGALRATTAVITSGIEPSAVEWYGPPSRIGTLLVRLDGTARSIDSAATEAARRLQEAGAGNLEILSDDASDESWAEPTRVLSPTPERVAPQTGSATIRLGTLPDQLPLVAEQVGALADQHHVAASLVSSTGIGVHTVRLTGPTAGQAAMIDKLGTIVQQLDGTLALRDRDQDLDQLRGTTAPMPKPPPTVALQRAIKDRFDPGHRLAPGRFAPWF